MSSNCDQKEHYSQDCGLEQAKGASPPLDAVFPKGSWGAGGAILISRKMFAANMYILKTVESARLENNHHLENRITVLYLSSKSY
jgi:hypothetical protein